MTMTCSFSSKLARWHFVDELQFGRFSGNPSELCGDIHDGRVMLSAVRETASYDGCDLQALWLQVANYER